MTKAMLTVVELAGRLRISRVTLDRRRNLGSILDPMKATLPTLRWDADEVEAWIAAGSPSAADWRRLKTEPLAAR